jgi:uncharacterized damage-inducible protein DinB
MTDQLRDHFLGLYRHLAWADARLVECLRSARNLQTRDLELYSHIVGAEHTWLCRINGSAPQVAVWPKLTIDEAERLARENAYSFTDLVGGLKAETFRKPVTYRNSAGDQFTSTVEDILTHVALHGAYHRGQIAISVRGHGDTPTPTDYIAFARGAPAATRQR